MEYLIKQKVFSLTKTFNILDASGNNLYIVKSSFFSFPKKIKIFNMAEKELGELVGHRFFGWKFKVFVEGRVSEIKKKMFSFRPSFELNIGGKDYTAEGDFFAHNFEIKKEGQRVAEMRRKMFSWGDTYSIVIDENEDQITLLLVVMAIDLTSQRSSSSSRRSGFRIGRRF